MNKKILIFAVIPFLVLFTGCTKNYNNEKMTVEYLNMIYKNYNENKVDYSYVDYEFNCDFQTSKQSKTGAFAKDEYHSSEECTLDTLEYCYTDYYFYELFYNCGIEKMFDNYNKKENMFSSTYDNVLFNFSLNDKLTIDIINNYKSENGTNNFSYNYTITYNENYMVSNVELIQYCNQEKTLTSELKISYR